MGKVKNQFISQNFLDERYRKSAEGGYPKAKWIEFCEEMLRQGFRISLYEAKKTFSKYITIYHGGQSFKVRFSNHKPIPQRELKGDCDFFVGVTNLTVSRTSDAIVAVNRWKHNVNQRGTHVNQENQGVRVGP